MPPAIAEGIFLARVSSRLYFVQRFLGFARLNRNVPSPGGSFLPVLYPLTNAPKMSTFVPKMGTSTGQNMLSKALFNKTRRVILGLLFTNTHEAYHLRGIVRLTGIGQGTIQRELKRLTEAGILTREVRGHQTYYRANSECPIFPELRGLVVKTVGVADKIRTALKPVEDRIRIALIYGSFASNTDTSASDVDLLVIGELQLRDIVRALGDLQQALGREINPTVYSPQEYQTKLSEGHHFLTSLQNEPKIYLIGDEDELNRLD